jgi:hypothetical protein
MKKAKKFISKPFSFPPIHNLLNLFIHHLRAGLGHQRLAG